MICRCCICVQVLTFYMTVYCADYVSSYEGIAYTSRPVGAASNGQEQTLFQALQQIVPQCFNLDKTLGQDSSDQSNSAAKTTYNIADPDAAASQDAAQDKEAAFLQTHGVLIAGVQPPLQTSLLSLHTALHAPDMFLYITVIAQ